MPQQPPLTLLLGILENVTHAETRTYATTDHTGRPMHTAKIIQDGPHDYLAIYHTHLNDNRFHTAIATSTDLTTWTRTHDYGPGTSQPTIAHTPDGGYLTAWEKDPHNHIALRYYPTRHALLTGQHTRAYDAPRTLSRCAEGTPNIYTARLGPDIDHSAIDLGAHYWWKCDRDRQMRALLINFTSWHPAPQPTYDNALLHHAVHGNIGSRDTLTLDDTRLDVIEAQHTKNDFGSWRIYVYDHHTHQAHPAAIRTDHASTAFANPKITTLTNPRGQRALLVSLFLPAEGAAPAEGGQLIYHTPY